MDKKYAREKKYGLIMNNRMQIFADIQLSPFDVKLDRMAKELVFMKKIVDKECDKKSGKITLEVTKGKFKTVTSEEDIFMFCENESEKLHVIEKASATKAATASTSSTPASDRLGRSAEIGKKSCNQ